MKQIEEIDMQVLKPMTTSVIVTLLSTTFWVQANAQTVDPAGMPMDPAVMQNMMQMRQQQMQSGQGGMPMMGGGNNMMMDPAIRQNMMQMHQQKMGSGMHGGMKNPQMMQNMMQMRQQHMNKMEQRLDRIESKLNELLDLQRKGG